MGLFYLVIRIRYPSLQENFFFGDSSPLIEELSKKHLLIPLFLFIELVLFKRNATIE